MSQLLPPAPPQYPIIPHYTPQYPFPEEKTTLGVMYGVLLWADMNTATPLGVWWRSVMSLAPLPPCPHIMPLNKMEICLNTETLKWARCVRHLRPRYFLLLTTFPFIWGIPASRVCSSIQIP